MRRFIFLFITTTLTLLTYSQEKFGDVLFWTAQSWECEYLEVKVFTLDSTLIADGKLKKRHTSYTMPECGSENVLNFEALPIDHYFFVTDCSREACSVCNGEGSYWQSTVQTKNDRTNSNSKNKGNIGGVYKTCHVCEGNGTSFQILWIDTFSVKENNCRTILLK